MGYTNTTPQFGLPQYAPADMPQREDFNKAFKTISENMGKGGNVESVNGKAGAVELNAVDVGASDNTLSNVVEIANWNTIRALLGAKSDDNLLDNWYFADPIDQRGGWVVKPNAPYYVPGASGVVDNTDTYYKVDSWAGTTGLSNAYFYKDGIKYVVNAVFCVRGYTGVGYGIDRWKLNNANGTVLVESDGILFTATGTTQHSEWIEWGFSVIAGKTLTISAIIDGVLYSKTETVPSTEPTKYTVFAEVSATDALKIRLGWSSSSARPEFVFAFSAAGSAKILAAKLELGDKQTLAHQDAEGNWVLNDPPPNKLIELLKCQYFYRLFATESARPKALADYHPPMRANPATGTIDINGVTYYYSDANL